MRRRIKGILVSPVFYDFAQRFDKQRADEIATEFLSDPNVHQVSVEPVGKSKFIVTCTLLDAPAHIWIVN